LKELFDYVAALVFQHVPRYSIGVLGRRGADGVAAIGAPTPPLLLQRTASCDLVRGIRWEAQGE